mmetsp:Transcript_2152/g.4520  ORF Transcript_2152/g.4520 Transcript_2152/m.4520 type:complete len:112 (+) Transcript_2152:55-390(+)
MVILTTIVLVSAASALNQQYGDKLWKQCMCPQDAIVDQDDHSLALEEYSVAATLSNQSSQTPPHNNGVISRTGRHQPIRGSLKRPSFHHPRNHQLQHLQQQAEERFRQAFS